MEIGKQSVCGKCGGRFQMIGRIGAVETYRCELCGNEEYAHFSISPDELYAAQEGTVEVCIDWREQDVDIKTIMKLRHLVPELKSQSVDEVRNSLHVGEAFRLGRYFPDQADNLKNKLEEIGLSVRCF